MMNLDEVLEQWIPYRLEAVQTLQFAWSWIDECEESREVLVFMEGQLKLRGNVASVANPMIEAGVIHARALLEFLGLCARKGHLAQIEKRQEGDIAVEHFSTAPFPLEKACPNHVLSTYPGPRDEAEGALLSTFELANKGLARITDGTLSGKWTDHHLGIACQGIPILINNYLYAKLGRAMPKAPEMVPRDAKDASERKG